jgi:hypothetical protein
MLAVGGVLVATLGATSAAWPAPAPNPAREIDLLAEPELALIRSLDAASRARELLRRYPPLGWRLANELLDGRLSLTAVREAIQASTPSLLLSRPLPELDDARLAQAGAVLVGPLVQPGPGLAVRFASWREALAQSLLLVARGAAFNHRQRPLLASARAQLKRTQALESHLLSDQAKLPDPTEQRRLAEALLASPTSVSRGAAAAEVPDPYEPGRSLTVPLDPAKDGIENAERFFARARRAESARQRITTRLAEVRAARAAAEAAVAAIASARTIDALAPSTRATKKTARGPTAGKPLHYLTTRGLSMLVGRGARENQALTFKVARPDDLWFHARDAPGAHVVLRDNEGRSQADDLREAAEVAAFFSAAAADAAVEVHVARRKHVRPGKGGPGRVVVGHSDTLRVKPRDPEGRLRRR